MRANLTNKYTKTFTSLPSNFLSYHMILMMVCDRRSALFSFHLVLSHQPTSLLQSINIFCKFRPVVLVSVFGSKQRIETGGYREYRRIMRLSIVMRGRKDNIKVDLKEIGYEIVV
jgi:hypothetical protein